MDKIVTKPNYVRFRAKSIKTGYYVYGDLAYVEDRSNKNTTIRTYIVKHCGHGGMIYLLTREKVDPYTIEYLAGFNENGEVYKSIR